MIKTKKQYDATKEQRQKLINVYVRLTRKDVDVTILGNATKLALHSVINDLEMHIEEFENLHPDLV